jgi:thymidine phosphorylase
LNIIKSDILEQEEASLSTYAWQLLGAKSGDLIYLTHPEPVLSFGFIRSKIYGHTLKRTEIKAIIDDALAGRLSDIHEI